MKNLHLITTEKSSKLYFFKKVLEYDTSCIHTAIGDIDKQHLYITSSEEIKNGYIKHVEHGICKVLSIKTAFIECETPSGVRMLHPTHCKKIILTTNPDLIKDGVQAIDDEFLQWFVKNPGCEEVEVILYGERPLFESALTPFYKIIIPKEEAKCFYNTTKSCENSACRVLNKCNGELIPAKQETLEEVVKNKFGLVDPILGKSNYRMGYESGLMEGAKYQAERMYSKEDLQSAFFNGGDMKDTEEFNHWFKQFKKKQL